MKVLNIESLFFRSRTEKTQGSTDRQTMIGSIGPGNRVLILEHTQARPQIYKITNIGNCTLVFFPAPQPGAPVPDKTIELAPRKSQKIIIEATKNGRDCFLMAHNKDETETGWYEVNTYRKR